MSEWRSLLRRPALCSITISVAMLFANVVQGNISLVWAIIATAGGLAGVAMVAAIAGASDSHLKCVDWGAAAGVFAGLAIGDYMLGIPWNNGGQPIPGDASRFIGPGIGAIAGALTGALASRLLTQPTPTD